MATTFDSGFSDWNPERLPSLEGKTYFITGANAGLGFEAAKMLRAKNANVLVGSRNEGRGKSAATNLAAEPGNGSVDFVKIDLADLSSIRDAADAVRGLTDGLDAIINNAGIMQTPDQKTADGFEMQFGTNHLGHFYMNHLLFDLVANRSGRIVPVSSIAHKPPAKLNFDNIMLIGHYSPSRAYGQSKLANLVYGLELHRRLESASSEVVSISCHPGYSATNLQSTGPTGIFKAIYKVSNALMAQPAERGAQPLVLSAAGVEARAGGYYGPTSMGGARGKISDSDIGGKIAMDPEAGRKLWELSEELLDISWTI
jgi:NAD(P)-dependent dehydrogenase (short-subunit alcohol dehydrogenase family)